MVHLWSHHRVEEYPRWKKIFDDTLDWRREMGEVSYRVYQRVDESDAIVVVSEWNAESDARDFLRSPELANRMDEAGVKGEPEALLLRQVDAGSVRPGR